MLDLDLDDTQQDLDRVVRQWLARTGVEPGTWSPGLWQGLADLGVLGLATDDGGGDAVDLVVAHGALGEMGTTGPLAATVMAAQLLPPAEATDVAAGALVPGVTVGDLVPWGQHAGVFLVVDDDGLAWRAERDGPIQAVATLGGEPWARVALHPTSPLGDARRACDLADLAVAAWLVGAGRRLVDRSADHARDRHQFGRPLGTFQAVAHRLARCDAELVAARDLVRITAWRLQEDAPASPGGARLIASRATLSAVYAAHQVHGALGYSTESHLGELSTAVRQRTLHPPRRGVHGRDRRHG